jgi:transposase, IS5 family
MRQRFEQQISLGSELISDVKFPLRSRDELPPVLKALQYIYVTPEINEKVFSLLENKVCKGKKKTGRPGMDLWHILVLAVVRHTLDTNYDLLTREILGIHINLWGAVKKEFSYQTIIDNVSLIDEKLLHEINQIVVEHGQDLLKKKGEENVLKLKTDSYALETNVHFPTDLNLLWDSIRKVLDLVEKLTNSNGWRKIKCIRSHGKSIFRSTSKQVFRGGYKDSKKTKEAVNIYLKYARQIYERTEVVIPTKGNEIKAMALLEELKHYRKYLQLFVGQVERRLIKGEEIAASEKIFSIFEPHTEWIKKGKLYPNVELGKLLLITTDQFQFIVDYKIMEHEKDASQVSSLYDRLKTNFSEGKIVSHSFDKGFYSKGNYKIIQAAGTEQVILPKKGKKNKAEQERESHPQFKKLRNKHSAVESNINMLEHHGLNRCPDKGLRGLKEYVGLSVLAYNLHILGNHLIAIEKKNEERLAKQRERYRKAA